LLKQIQRKPTNSHIGGVVLTCIYQKVYFFGFLFMNISGIINHSRTIKTKP
jgi:hypothetical protein